MMKVAITGGIGEGKSTVLAAIAGLGRETASSDEMARKLMAWPEVQSEVAEALGLHHSPEFRQALRLRLSEAPAARRRLNQVLHPRIVAALEASPAEFIEVPLLFEACLQGCFDRVWVVTCGREEQLARLEARYGSKAEAEAMAATQLDSEAKAALADEVVRTNGSKESVCQIVASLVASLG